MFSLIPSDSFLSTTHSRCGGGFELCSGLLPRVLFHFDFFLLEWCFSLREGGFMENRGIGGF